MKILKYLLISFLLSFVLVNTSFSENFDDIKYPLNINISETLKIDLSKEKENLEKQENQKVIFEWNVTGENIQTSKIFNKKFKNFGNKIINLNIYKIVGSNKELIKNKTFKTFVYKNKLKLIYSKEDEGKIREFENKANELGIYIEKFAFINNSINKYDFKEKIISKNLENNYILIWGTKDFLFDIFSKINTENIEQNISFVAISSFNINILQKFLSNFVSNKIWVKEAILIDESSRYEVLKEVNNIQNLKKILEKDNYSYINLNSKSKIHNLLFISNFVNTLSNNGFQVQNIYILILIPFLLLGVSIFKHIIGLTPSGLLIPLSITILLFKLGIIITFLILTVFLCTNLILSKLISKYNLHYTPKISMLTIINIVVFIILINILIKYNILYINSNDIIFIILFILIAEKLINIIINKEFVEYRFSLINTMIFSIISYLFLSINFVKSFLLAYPELILFLIPIAFFIGRFTGLRVSEYFRFKEVIKSIEEE